MKNINFILTALVAFVMLNACSSGERGDMASPSGSSGSGKAGSMARFAVVGNYLYTLNNEKMQLFDISEPSNPTFKNEMQIWGGVETIYPYQNMLFMGTQQGMHIYDNSNPGAPRFLSTHQHMTACDPVVVQGNYAYVTLRNGVSCRQAINQLEIIDISNPLNPQVVRTFPMTNPHGLDIVGNTLFVCEGDAGLRVFDASGTPQLSQLAFVRDMHAYDVIAMAQSVMVIGNDGLYQYDYSDPKNLKLLSKIPVRK